MELISLSWSNFLLFSTLLSWQDIKLKGDLKALTPNAIADFTFTCEYSALQNEHLVINTKLVNRSDATLFRKAKELELHVDHPVSNVEIDMFL